MSEYVVNPAEQDRMYPSQHLVEYSTIGILFTTIIFTFIEVKTVYGLVTNHSNRKSAQDKLELN